MSSIWTVLTGRARLFSAVFGSASLMALAAVFGGLFSPADNYTLLSDVHDLAPSGRYQLDWTTKQMSDGGVLTEGEAGVYGSVLAGAMSGKLAAVDEARLEPQALSILQADIVNDQTERTFRIRSRVLPVFALANKSLAVFDIETDTLTVGFDPVTGRLNREALTTIRETVRVAETRRGLAIRHIEQVAPAQKVATAVRIAQSPPSNRVAGFNYYPETAPWGLFWTAFPEQEIEDDFGRMAEMGANSVRLFLTREAFEAPDLRDQSLQRLKTVLDLAERYRVGVILTCFDLGAEYRLSGLANSWAHLQVILAAVSGHPAVLAIDLKNEPDLDDKTWGQGQVDLWLSTLLQLAQTDYPQLRYTIGWSSAVSAVRLADKVDIVSFHDYLEPATLSDRMSALHEVAGDKPVWLTEIGHPTWTPIPRRSGQTKRLQTQLAQAVSLNGVFIWTLNDFDHVPNSVAGWRPWRKAMQARYGLNQASRKVVSNFFTRFIQHSPDLRPQYGDYS